MVEELDLEVILSEEENEVGGEFVKVKELEHGEERACVELYWVLKLCLETAIHDLEFFETRYRRENLGTVSNRENIFTFSTNEYLRNFTLSRFFMLLVRKGTMLLEPLLTREPHSAD